jgi:hypothetical protein
LIEILSIITIIHCYSHYPYSHCNIQTFMGNPIINQPVQGITLHLTPVVAQLPRSPWVLRFRQLRVAKPLRWALGVASAVSSASGGDKTQVWPVEG